MQFFVYALIRLFGFLISILPYRLIHVLGAIAGDAAYHLHRSFRKKALTNLAIAYGMNLSEKKRRKIAKQAFRNLTITCLEFFKLKKSKGNLSEIVKIEGGQEILDLLEKNQGIIFLSGHQANWEIPFLAMSDIYPGIAIGRPIKNPWLYRWVLSVREMNGGKIVMPRSAIRQSLKALKEGKFVGIVGDQAFPESSYSYPLLGTRAWSTTMPALLAYRTNSPIVVGKTRRVGNKYIVEASPPIWPDLTKPRQEEVVRLMDCAMGYLEQSIQETPGQWLWQHDRWKQQGIDHVKRKYRFGFVLIILPPDPSDYLKLLPIFREIYPRAFLTFFVPPKTEIPLPGCEVSTYTTEKELFVRDYRYQIVLDFYDSARLRRHYRKLGAFQTLNLKKMASISQAEGPLDQIIKRALIKEECLPKDTISTSP